MRRLLIALAATLAVLLPSAPAWAHNQLVQAFPAQDSTLTAAPATVKLTFVQPLNPQFTTVVVSTAARQRVPAGDPTTAGQTSTVALNQHLANGIYTVAFRTVSIDGHVVQGAYTFTVADPTKPAAAVSSPPAATSSATTGTSGIPTPLLFGLAGLGLTLAVLALTLRSRNRRSARGAGPATHTCRCGPTGVR